MNEKDLKKIGKLHPKVLIAGGAGFLGVRLSRELIDHGFEVLVLDDFSSSLRLAPGETGGSREDLKALCSHKRFKFITCDINEKFSEEVTREPPDFIFHLARFEIHPNRRHSLLTLLTNALGTKNLLDLAKKASARFLLASPIIPTYQDNEADARKFAGALVREYAKEFNLNVRIAQIAEVYGPGADLASMGTLGRLIKEMLAGEDLTVYGDGLGKEYYTYIDDAISGLLEAMFAQKTSGRSIFISPSEPVTTLELAYLVREVSLPRTPLETKPLTRRTRIAFRVSGGAPGDPTPAAGCVGLGQMADFSGKMTTPLPEGVRLMIESLKEAKASEYREAPPAPHHSGTGRGWLQSLRDWWDRLDDDKPEPLAPEEAGITPTLADFPVAAGPWPASFGPAKGVPLQCFCGALRNFWEGRKKDKVKRRRGEWKVAPAVFVLSFCLSILPLQVLASRLVAAKSFEEARQGFTAFNLEVVGESGEEAVFHSRRAEAGLRRLLWLLDIFGRKGWGLAEMRNLRALRYFSEFLIYGAQAAVPLEKQLHQTTPISFSGEEISLALGDLRRAYNMLLLGQAEAAEAGRHEFITQSKSRLTVLEVFLENPKTFESLDALREELLEHGWDL